MSSDTDTAVRTSPDVDTRQRSPLSAVAQRPQIVLVPLVAVLVVGGWEIIVKACEVPAYVLPPPSAIVTDLLDQFGRPTFWENVRYTAMEAGLGFLIAAVLAMIVAILVTQFRLLDAAIFPYIVMLETVPKLALAPLFIIWFGFGITSKIVTTILVCFFPILLNASQGLRSTRPEKIELMMSLKASRIQTFRKVIFPEALPFIFTGLNLGIIFAVIGAVVAEFVGARAGLGHQLLQYNYEFNISGLFAVLVVLSAMGLVGHLVIRFAHRRIVFWASWGDSPK